MREAPLFLPGQFAEVRLNGEKAHIAEVGDSWYCNCCSACRDLLSRKDYLGCRRGFAGWGRKDFVGCRNCGVCCRYDSVDPRFAGHRSMGC